MGKGIWGNVGTLDCVGEGDLLMDMARICSFEAAAPCFFTYLILAARLVDSDSSPLPILT